MDFEQKRRADRRQARVRELIRERFDGNQTKFAEAVGCEQNYISRVLSNGEHRKNIGEQMARRIEKSLRLPALWLDADGGKAQVSERVTFYGMEISKEAVLLAREWDQLQPAWREQVRTLIEMLVAQQKRDERPAKQSPLREAP